MCALRELYEETSILFTGVEKEEIPSLDQYK